MYSKLYEQYETIQSHGACCCKTTYNPRERTMHHFDMICDSEQTATEWKNRIIQAGYGGDAKIVDQVPEKKKILALLNPFGGRGLAA